MIGWLWKRRQEISGDPGESLKTTATLAAGMKELESVESGIASSVVRV